MISNASKAVRGCVLLTVALLLTGCAHAINPFADEAATEEEMKTHSEELARSAEVSPIVRRREWPQQKATYPKGDVVHWPLWFEDPFEDKGSEDGRFAWTVEDYVALPYSFARLLLNTMGCPVSMCMVPPGTPMVSDGYLSRQALGMDHDARPLGKPDTPPSPDEEATEDVQRVAGAEGPPAADDYGPPYAEPARFQEQ